MTRHSSWFFCATLVVGSALGSCRGGSDDTGAGGVGGDAGAGGGGGGAGGTSVSSDPLEIVPLDNEVSDWYVDLNSTKPGVRAMTGATLKQVENLIDGGATPFFASYTPKLFMWQNYINTQLPAAPADGATLMLYVLQMSSEEDAGGLYTSVLKTPEYGRKVGTPDDWQDPTAPPMGDDSRIQDTGTAWWVNFRKKAFYVEVLLAPSYGPPPDYTIGDADLKNEALRFAQAIASRL